MADLRPAEVREADRKRTFKDRLYEVPYVGVALRMQDRYNDDDADQHAAAIGFFGFVSLFPLLLLGLAVAGMLLSADPQRQADVADALIDAIPGFRGAFGEGDTAVESALAGLSRNAGGVGLIGLLTLLPTGLKVINSANRATLAVFHVDVTVAGFVMRVRQVGVLVLLGILAILGVAATGLVGAAAAIATEEAAGLGGDDVNRVLQAVTTVAGLAASVLVDFALFVAAYKLLSFGRGPAYTHVWPGALLAAVGWTALKAFGATYVSGQIAKTNAAIGALGGVVGLLLLLYLAGRVYVYGAELAALLRNPGLDLAHRYETVIYEGEDADVIGVDLLAGKAQLARREGLGDDPGLLFSPVSAGLTGEPARASAAGDEFPTTIPARDVERDAQWRVAAALGLLAGAVLAFGSTARSRRFPW